jgi:hypothetical protein
MRPRSYHLVEKSFRDYSKDIEAVNIHYVVCSDDTPPDWSLQSTLYVPRVEGEIRKVALNLPLSIKSSNGVTSDYLLHYYFEIVEGGDRVYSPQFTEKIETGFQTAAHVQSAHINDRSVKS